MTRISSYVLARGSSARSPLVLARARALAAFAAFALTAAPGCGDDQDPKGAQELWDRVHAEDYQSWKRAPGYEARKATNAPHSDEVDIYVNTVMDEAIASGQTTWPDDSLIVKDGFSGSEHDIVAIMEKRAGVWYWAEYDADSGGEATYSGKPDICTGCHSSGRDYVRLWNP
jgi:hypothetical protein